MFKHNENKDFIKSDNLSIDNPYYDLSFDDFKKVHEVYGAEAIDNAIENVLCTEPGERVFNISFFSPVYAILFENFGDIQEQVNNIFNAIEYWVPIKINRELAEISADKDNHAVSFKIPYISLDGMISSVFARRITK